MLRNNEIAYGKVTKTLHWLMAICLIAMVILGEVMEDALPSQFTRLLFDTHKSLGVTLLGLALVRILWRFISPPPPIIVDGTKPWEQKLAKFVHIGIYVLMVSVPFSGWVGASASGHPMHYFGITSLPAIVSANKMISNAAFDAHEIMVKLLILFFFLHVIGALKRHFFNKDDTLRRMLPMK